MKKRTFLALLFCFLLPLSGCGDSNIDLVKNASFRGYETTTIGKMLDSTFEKTKWSSQQNPKGEILVLFEGKIPQKMHDSLKGQLLQRLAAESRANDKFFIATFTTDYIPTVLGRDRTGDKFAQPLLGECVQKYTNVPLLPQNVKPELDQARASLAKARSWADGEMLRTYEIDVEELEQKWAIVQEMQSPAWETGKKKCADQLMKITHSALDDLYWMAGDTVFFEWKIHSDGKLFELSRFGGQSMPSISLNRILEIIYKQ